MSNPSENAIRRRLLVSATAAAVFPDKVFGLTDGNNQERTDLKVRLTFDRHEMTATLCDNPSARDFASMLPLELEIDDFGTKEKIAHLPRKLRVEGHGPFSNVRPYDLCYYMPWGNLAMFYADYRHPGLVRRGHFDDGSEVLHIKGKFPLRIEPIQ